MRHRISRGQMCMGPRDKPARVRSEYRTSMSHTNPNTDTDSSPLLQTALNHPHLLRHLCLVFLASIDVITRKHILPFFFSLLSNTLRLSPVMKGTIHHQMYNYNRNNHIQHQNAMSQVCPKLVTIFLLIRCMGQRASRLSNHCTGGWGLIRTVMGKIITQQKQSLIVQFDKQHLPFLGGCIVQLITKAIIQFSLFFLQFLVNYLYISSHLFCRVSGYTN